MSSKKILTVDEMVSLLSKTKDSTNIDLEAYKLILSDVISGSITLNAEAFHHIIKELIVLNATPTSTQIITSMKDVTSQENFVDFLTFVEDGKQYYVIGDLHADLKSFLHILEAINFATHFDSIKLIFLGDYIDRGKDKIELINRIIFLKYLLPNNIFLLKGNHELYSINDQGHYSSPMMHADSSYFFNFLTQLATDEKFKQYGVTKEYIKLYVDFFDSLPTVALFHFNGIKICAAHGGLPRPDLDSKTYFGSEPYTSFNTLLSPNTKDCVGISQKNNMLWSDPYDGFIEGFRNSSEVRFGFTKEQFISFCEKFDIDLFLRAHEQFDSGYKSYFDNRLISVFSSGGKDLESGITANPQSYYENVSPNILRITSQKITSININFSTEFKSSIEEIFSVEDSINFRKIHQNSPIQNNIFNIQREVNSVEGAIHILDCYSVNTIKIFHAKEDPIVLTHNELQQFYGIHKDLVFSIDYLNKKVTSMCEIPIYIGVEGAIIIKNESITVDSTCILRLSKGACLKIVL